MSAPQLAIVSAEPERAPAQGFEPYIPAKTNLPELTPLPLIVGTLLGMIFGASSLYLVLKVGLTVSASIPVAVISITLFRLLGKLGGRDATILENNIVQTAGSAGESIAFGVGVTMPAIMILGFDLEIARVMLVAVLGGLLGILMMIPLRRALIVQQHGVFEISGRHGVRRGVEGRRVRGIARGGIADRPSASRPRLGGAATSANTIFTGFGIGLVYKALMVAFKGWKDVPQKSFRRAVQRRLGCSRDFTRAARRRLHHRSAHRVDHVRGRRARVPGADSGDQVFRRGADRTARARHRAD